MGAKKPTIRTLPSGEKVTHYPSGEQVLVPTNTMANLLGAQEQDMEKASAELREANLARVEEKRERQQAGNPVPADKTPL